MICKDVEPLSEFDKRLAEPCYLHVDSKEGRIKVLTDSFYTRTIPISFINSHPLKVLKVFKEGTNVLLKNIYCYYPK